MKLTGPAHYQTLEYERIVHMVGGWVAGNSRQLRILDFGCGKGRYLKALASLGVDVLGVDANADYVSEANAAGLKTLLADDFLAKSFGSFDVILVSHVIEHLRPDELVELIPRLCSMLDRQGRLVIVSPVPGERFFHDFSHVRPYLPQSIRHAFGQSDGPIIYGRRNIIELVDIHFFRDPFRTRLWRSFYIDRGIGSRATRFINTFFDWIWRLSGGSVGVTASWLGVYEHRHPRN